jgi:adenylyltransferase/sulfurtransferase
MADCTVSELKERLDAGTAPALLDVRQPEEVAICRIEGAVLLPMNEIPGRLTELEDFVDTELVVYCHHGMRSASVQAFLQRQGFTHVRNLIGGIDRYSLEADPTVPRY